MLKKHIMSVPPIEMYVVDRDRGHTCERTAIKDTSCLVSWEFQVALLQYLALVWVLDRHKKGV